MADGKEQEKAERKPHPLNARTFESAIDQQIARAVGEGKFDNLPGQGRPQRLDEDVNVPEELRLGYRFLKSSGFAPPWVEARRDIEQERRRLEEWLARGNDRWPYLTDQARAGLSAEYRTRLQEFHRMVLNYNLSAPPGAEHLANIRIDEELRRLGRSDA